MTYAKASPEDILVEIEVVNRGPEAAPLHVLPTLWFRNTWSWGLDARKPRARKGRGAAGHGAIAITHPHYGDRTLYAEGAPELLFTENETNNRRLFGAENDGPYVKDALPRARRPRRRGGGEPGEASARRPPRGTALDVPGGRLAEDPPAPDGRERRPSRSAPVSTRSSRRAAPRPTPSTRA